MTDLQRVEISGFKGIEHLAYEPSGINLVTGRNNTGKTSLLEAIALAFDPTYVEEFGEDIDSLIHEDFEECRITVETEEETREVSFRHPTPETAGRYFAFAVTTYVMENANFEVAVGEERHSLLATIGDDVDEAVRLRVASLVFDVVEAQLGDGLRDELQGDCLVFGSGGDEFPHVVFGDTATTLVEESAERLSEDPRSDSGANVAPLVIETISWTSGSFPQFAVTVENPGFLDEPPARDETILVGAEDLHSAPEHDPDSGDVAKQDEVGAYIEEMDLVDELQTFGLDELVFEKDTGETYVLPYDSMGDGFKTLVGLLWELLGDEVSDRIVLFEEPGSHLHPDYVLDVVHFLVELAREDVQLFVTTHNKDFIDALFNENRTGEQETFLEEEFTLLRLESESAMVGNYETTRESIEDLHLDPRGI